MRLVVRWGVAVVVSAAGFALAWWICEKLIRLDESVSLGIAGAVLAVLLAVAAWWAPLKASNGGADSAGRQQAPSGGEKAGGVANTISGGTFSGPVLQGRALPASTLAVLRLSPRPARRSGSGLMTSQDGGKTSNEVSGGTFNGPVLQGGSFVGTTFVTQQAAPAPVALAQLPPLTAGFTGRHNELALFTRLLNPAADAEAVVVSAVAGLAGVGKTALAVQAAHAARSSGWFAGGVLFIDLHGHDSSPVQPGQALDALLRALGVPGEHVPEGVEQRAGLYRSALAQIADPVLIVADNASAEAQVRLLMPGPGPHRVIITSRHTLAGLGARLLDVTVLGQAVAVQLLDEAVRAGRPDDERISGDPAAARKLALVCGGLPLALQITAALLVADSALSAAELAAEMADEVRRLAALRYDDGSGVNAPSVAAAFELSYRQLDEEAVRLFRLLPANPGPDASTAAAAELAAGQPAGRGQRSVG